MVGQSDTQGQLNICLKFTLNKHLSNSKYQFLLFCCCNISPLVQNLIFLSKNIFKNNNTDDKRAEMENL